jgi:putative acetyltransferase
MEYMKMLETERLRLRRFVPEDLDDFYEYCQDPQVGPAAGWKTHESREESLEILLKFADDEKIWALELKAEQKVVGSIGLHMDEKRRHDKALMLGFVLSRPYWGRGLAAEASRRLLTYAFAELKIELVSLFHYPFNLQCGRVALKCGFCYEGALRQAQELYNGEIIDNICYSLTAEEFWAREYGS